MNRNMIRRWLNEYLDGEIGLADKAELERIMQENPQVRAEYRELRQIGLLMGNTPEIVVKPYAFRQRLAERLDAGERPMLTPQSAFSAAMLVALLVIGISLSFFMFQQKELGSDHSGVVARSEAGLLSDNYVSLNAPVSADKFFTRLLVEYQLGLQEQSVMAPFLNESEIYEGSLCVNGNPLEGVRFAQPLPNKIRVNVLPGAAVKLARLASDLAGQPVILRISGAGNETETFQEFIRERGQEQPVSLVLVFH